MSSSGRLIGFTGLVGIGLGLAISYRLLVGVLSGVLKLTLYMVPGGSELPLMVGTQPCSIWFLKPWFPWLPTGEWNHWGLKRFV